MKTLFADIFLLTTVSVAHYFGLEPGGVLEFCSVAGVLCLLVSIGGNLAVGNSGASAIRQGIAGVSLGVSAGLICLAWGLAPGWTLLVSAIAALAPTQIVTAIRGEIAGLTSTLVTFLKDKFGKKP